MRISGTWRRWVKHLRPNDLYRTGHSISVHYSDVIIGAMASQSTGVSIVCLTICSGAYRIKASKLRVTRLCEEKTPGTGGFLSQRTSYGEDFFFISWRHNMNMFWDIVNIHVYSICRSLSIWRCFIPLFQRKIHFRNSRLAFMQYGNLLPISVYTYDIYIYVYRLYK